MRGPRSPLWAIVALCACEAPRIRATPAPCVPGESVVCSRIHPEGILDPDSPDHHGLLLRGLRYDLAACSGCHGRDFAGGPSGASCLGCHEGGPTACATCHERTPDQGAHAAHLGGRTVATPEACADCHVVPARWDAPGHLFTAGGALDARPAEVALSGAAARGAPADRLPRYDAATRTCSDVTCHGGLIPDTGAADPAPRWDAPPRDLGCARCHGDPPTTPYHVHAVDRCEACHSQVIGPARAWVDEALHVDGRVEVGPDGAGRCEGCHAGIGDEPMHRAHLRPQLRLGGALDCADCHAVPAAVTSAGHLDSPPPAEVFPLGHAGIAWTRGAQPAWDAAAGTCAGTACHGRDSTVAWRRFPAQLVCGSCHGVPPADAAHDPAWTVRACSGCHDSVDDFGNPRLVETATTGALGDPSGLRSRHMDGEVDLR